MDKRPISNTNFTSNCSQKRPVQEMPGTYRQKRAKYTSAACNECKRCKIKCIRMGDDADCQRCATMDIPCIVVQTAVQSVKNRAKEDKSLPGDDHHYVQLSEDVGSLRQQLTDLTATVAALSDRVSRQSSGLDGSIPESQPAYKVNSSTTSLMRGEPRQPQFVGPTRPAFSFKIAETSLTRMGISTNQHKPLSPLSRAPSREPTAEPVPQVGTSTLPPEFDSLLTFSADEIARYISIYEEEVVCCHPILNTKSLMHSYPHILGLLKHPNRHPIVRELGGKDIHMLRLVAATAITHETPGRSDLCEKLIATVEREVERISSDMETELKDVQIMAMLSIYFCHVGEELFAWRAIGRAARQALEMGLHRQQNLVDNFKDEATRNFALQIFWVVYALDRRWSFGTSLSFALNDRDIDAKLPEPSGEHPYLKCTVAYGKLCSRVWEALPPYGSSSLLIPKETEDYLAFITQNWLSSIPQELQFRHPRLGLAPNSQPRALQRLRTLCYLHGNYIRLLIHRHHVLTPDDVSIDMRSARLVVDVAKDSIEVLDHFNQTSDIYVSQQTIYHFYLLSSLAVMLLAVCHAPGIFSETCRDAFVSAVELVKGFSRHSSASRRLWKSIRGLLPIINSLGNQEESEGQHGQGPENEIGNVNEVVGRNSKLAERTQPQNMGTGEIIDRLHNLWAEDAPYPDENLSTSILEVSNMSHELLNIYDFFGSAGTSHSMQLDGLAGNGSGPSFSVWDTEEISRQFHDLI